MMNLLHWRLVVAVADAGNISRAAEEIGMTQSGASQAIAQLEASGISGIYP
jgi:DNA-binding transcriptional LysR family regulator